MLFTQSTWRPCVGLVFLLLISTVDSHAQPSGSFGLAPSSNDRMVGEARTASSAGTSSLYYNPAGLARRRWQLRLIGYQTSMSQSTVSAAESEVEAKSQEESSSSIQYSGDELLTLLGSGVPHRAEFAVSTMGLAIPYLGAEVFSNLNTTLMITGEAANPTAELNARLRVGAIAGIAFSVGKLDVGYSQYRIAQAEVMAAATRDYIETTRDALDAGTLSYEDLPYSDFVTATEGRGIGHNIGLNYRPYGNDSPLLIGAAVLNVGGTQLDGKRLTTNKAEESYEHAVEKFTLDFGIVPTRPKEIAEAYSLGVGAGWGGDASQFAFFQTSVEARHTSGREKFEGAAGIEGGFHIPMGYAHLTSIEFKPKNSKTSYFAGFYGAEVGGGIQSNGVQTSGATIIFHAGFEMISLLQIRISGVHAVDRSNPELGTLTTGVDVMFDVIF